MLVGVFLQLSDGYLIHFCQELRIVWQGIFPPIGGSCVAGVLPPVPFCHPAGDVCNRLSVLCAGEGCSSRAEHLSAAIPGYRDDSGMSGLWSRSDRYQPYHQVQRSEQRLLGVRVVVDVRYAYCISVELCGEPHVAQADGSQPGYGTYRGVQVRRFRCG